MTTWNEVQAKAATPGSRILTEWRAQQEAQRAISNASNGANEAIVSSDPRVVELLLGGGLNSAAGVAITPASAMRVSAVYACVTRIGGAVSPLSNCASINRAAETFPAFALSKRASKTRARATAGPSPSSRK